MSNRPDQNVRYKDRVEALQQRFADIQQRGMQFADVVFVDTLLGCFLEVAIGDDLEKWDALYNTYYDKLNEMLDDAEEQLALAQVEERRRQLAVIDPREAERIARQAAKERR